MTKNIPDPSITSDVSLFDLNIQIKVPEDLMEDRDIYYWKIYRMLKEHGCKIKYTDCISSFPDPSGPMHARFLINGKEDEDKRI